MTARKTSRRSAPTWAYRSLTLLLAVTAIACGADDSADEVVHLKAVGSCIQGTQTFDLRQSGGLLSVVAAEGGSAPPFPPRGTLDKSRNPIRAGGWLLWGCLSGAEPCFEQFRYCGAKRQAWQLDVTCLDGHGEVACQAVLTE